ncbi:MAG TPA: tryptophan--tRNA ligase, partial [Candidatus Cloacimonadota bacterium]|nr:tryptophan--tRNA ligase [Candidatus Cloacimonadota bacterium]
LVMKIVTNSQGIEEPKDPETCNVFAIYKAFATEEQVEALRQRYLAGGMGWGHAKQELFEVLNQALSPVRQRYQELLENRGYVHQVLAKGAIQARELAAGKIKELRSVIGIN